jgi:hypothetical protein
MRRFLRNVKNTLAISYSSIAEPNSYAKKKAKHIYNRLKLYIYRYSGRIIGFQSYTLCPQGQGGK